MAKERKVFGLLLRIIGLVLPSVSPMIRKAVEDAVRRLYEMAVKTDNPADDALVEALAELLDIELR